MTAHGVSPEWIPDVPGVRAARLVSAAAERAACVWRRPVSSDDLPVVAACVELSMVEMSSALAQLAQYRPTSTNSPVPANPHEPNIHISAAAKVLSCIGYDLRQASEDLPADGRHLHDSAAIEAARSLSDATYAAFTSIGQPAGSSGARDAAVNAFMHAIDLVDAAIGNLAEQAPKLLAAVLARQQLRLEQAAISLREALVCAAVRRDDPDSASRARCLRERLPILPHRSGNRSAEEHKAGRARSRRTRQE